LDLQDSKSDRFLLRAVKFSALRLLVTTFEIAPQLSSVSTYMLALVQVAMNILADPKRAAIELYGLSFRRV
jgi:hypothetical protein